MEFQVYGFEMVFSGNDPQFARKKLKWFLEELKIEHPHASVKHVQSNRHIEAANKTILNNLKKRLDALKGKWMEQLENFFWALRTTPKKVIGETPFSLVYGSKAVTLTEIAVTSHKVKYFEGIINDEQRSLELDLVDEK